MNPKPIHQHLDFGNAWNGLAQNFAAQLFNAPMAYGYLLIIAEKLKIDIEKEALMFGIKDKKLHVFKEEKESDNYHLGIADAHTYRFRSIELYNFLSDFYKKPKEKEFYIEMDDDFTFKLANIA